MKNPYKVLNVPKDASQEDIKKAYHNKAKQEHPDVGGDEEKFKDTTNAYALLISPAKRKHYDEFGGEMPNEQSILGKAYSVIDSMVTEIFNQYTPERLAQTDFLKDMKMALNANLDKTHQQIREIEQQVDKENLSISKLRTIFDEKLKFKKSKIQINIFTKNLDNKEELVKLKSLAINQLNDKKLTIKKALEIIDDFDFEVDRTVQDDFMDKYEAASLRGATQATSPYYNPFFGRRF